MPWRSHSHAHASPRDPRAWGKCDRCGSVYELEKLAYQFDWVGPRLRNKRLRVCQRCMDRPQEQLRMVHVGPDPRPVKDPRPINDAAVMGGYAALAYSVVEIPAQPIFASDTGLDIGPDSTVANRPIQTYGTTAINSDTGNDIGMDATTMGPAIGILPNEPSTATAIGLRVFPSGADVVQGYPGSPFSSEQDERASLALPIDVDPDGPVD